MRCAMCRFDRTKLRAKRIVPPDQSIVRVSTWHHGHATRNQRDHRMFAIRLNSVLLASAMPATCRAYSITPIACPDKCQIGYFVSRASEWRRSFLGAALAKTTRHQDCIKARQALHTLGFERFGVDIFDIHVSRSVYTAWRSASINGLVGFSQFDIFANHAMVIWCWDFPVH